MTSELSVAILVIVFTRKLERRYEVSYKYNALKGRIYEKFDNMTIFADALGVPVSQISRRLNGEVGFSQKDIETWATLLEIKPSEYGKYFFA